MGYPALLRGVRQNFHAKSTKYLVQGMSFLLQIIADSSTYRQSV
jgi:hypothetical protein